MNKLGGYTNYGQDIGILMLDTVFPRIVGDIGNARTFDFPVKYRVVKNVFTDKKIPKNADDVLLDAFIKAAKDLESEGCKAITTSCGFLAGFQQQLASAVNIPVFTSILMMVPIINTMIGNHKSIGIFTEQKELLNEDLFLKTGWSSKDISVEISGLPENSEFNQLVIYDKAEGDFDGIRKSIEDMAKQHMKMYPDTGAIVLECQNFAPFGQLIQDICQVPVFGMNQLIAYVEQCVNYRTY